MACETIALTTNINDCCVLQILCDGIINYEFLLSELRIIDKGDSFILKDRVTQLDLSNYTIDMTAEQIRDARCTCSQGAAGLCGYLESGTNYLYQGTFGWGYTFPADSQDAIDFLKTALGTYLDVSCNVGAYYDSGSATFWIVQNQNGTVVVVAGNSAP